MTAVDQLTKSNSANAGMQLPEPAGPLLTQHRRPALSALTGLRFFAAMYVVLHHTGYEFARRHHANRLLTTFLDHGVASVALFFMLSGFILSYTYKGQLGDGPLRFWQARFSRIYPVYALSLLLCLGVSTPISFAQRLAVLSTVQAWLPRHPALVAAWNYPAWTLSVEAAFYLIFPLVMRIAERWSERTLRTWVCVLIVYSFATRSVAHQPGTEVAWSTLAQNLPYPVLRLPEFLIGLFMGLLFLKQRGRAAETALALTVLSLLLLLALPSDWALAATILPFSLLVYLLAAGGTRLASFLSAPTMLFLGGASYSLYLLQAPVRGWTRVLFTHMPPAIRSLDFAISPVLLLLLSCVVFRYFEEPTRKRLRESFAKLQI